MIARVADQPTPLLVLTPEATTERRAMRATRDALRAAMDACDGPVRLLFDLRGCRPGLEHLRFTVDTLLTHEAYMRSKLVCSAAILPAGNGAIKPLCDLFAHIYTPVRPFTVEVDADTAWRFVERGELSGK